MRKAVIGVQPAGEKAHSGHDRDDGVIARPACACWRLDVVGLGRQIRSRASSLRAARRPLPGRSSSNRASATMASTAETASRHQ